MNRTWLKVDWRSKWRWVFLGLAGSLLALSVIMVAGPAWIYAGNADEFSASFPQIFAVYAPYLLGASAIILAALILLPLPITRVAAIILAIIGLAAWVQGTFLVHDFGPLDGQNWAIELPWWQTILELVAIATAAFAVWRLSLRAPCDRCALDASSGRVRCCRAHKQN